MTKYSFDSAGSPDGEVPGVRAFYAAIIVALAMLLMGAVWQVAPHTDQVHAATQQAEIAQSDGGTAG
jgi:hypothetical protein